MRILMAMVAAAAFTVALGMSYVTAVHAGEMTMVMEGYIIDTKCATANKAELGTFVKEHTKQCAMMPACHASGYNFYSEGQLWVFDKDSSDKVYKFLEKPDSTLHVSIEMSHGKGNNIKLVSIKNAK